MEDLFLFYYFVKNPSGLTVVDAIWILPDLDSSACCVLVYQLTIRVGLW